jgi:hypothetical protein
MKKIYPSTLFLVIGFWQSAAATITKNMKVVIGNGESIFWV